MRGRKNRRRSVRTGRQQTDACRRQLRQNKNANEKWQIKAKKHERFSKTKRKRTNNKQRRRNGKAKEEENIEEEEKRRQKEMKKKHGGLSLPRPSPAYAAHSQKITRRAGASNDVRRTYHVPPLAAVVRSTASSGYVHRTSACT